MNNNKLDMSKSEMEEKSPKELRKPVKRLNAKVRVMVKPKNSSNKKGNPGTSGVKGAKEIWLKLSIEEKEELVAGNLQIPRRSPNTAYKNFLRQFKRCNPGALAVEGASLWRKMSREEKQEFQKGSQIRLQTTRK